MAVTCTVTFRPRGHRGPRTLPPQNSPPSSPKVKRRLYADRDSEFTVNASHRQQHFQNCQGQSGSAPEPIRRHVQHVSGPIHPCNDCTQCHDSTTLTSFVFFVKLPFLDIMKSTKSSLIFCLERTPKSVLFTRTRASTCFRKTPAVVSPPYSPPPYLPTRTGVCKGCCKRLRRIVIENNLVEFDSFLLYRLFPLIIVIIVTLCVHFHHCRLHRHICHN